MSGSLRSVASFDVHAWGEGLFKPAPKIELGGNSNLPPRSEDSQRSTSAASTVSSLGTFDEDAWKKKMDRSFKPEKNLELDLNPNPNSDTPRTATPTREHHPGAARSKQLRDILEADRGKKSRVYEYLPTNKGKFYREVKQWLKNEALACQLKLLEMGSASDDKAIEKLHEMLTSRLKKRDDLNEKMAELALKYIDKKYGGKNGKLDFVATEDGGVFPTEGTNLDGPVIRTRNGKLFQLVTQLTDKDKEQLLLQDHTGNTIELGEGGTAKTRLARQLKKNGIKFVAVKDFTNLDAGARELQKVDLVPRSDYRSKILETFTDKHKAYIFMDLASYGSSLDAQKKIWMISEVETHEIAERTLATHYVKAALSFKEQELHHLDIKPENYLVRSNGSVMLSDFETVTADPRFGIHAGTVINAGTREYMDPLVRTCGAFAADADKYSLGATLYYLAVGRLPTELRWENGKWVDEEIPLEKWKGFDAAKLDGIALWDVAMKLMDKDPAERPSLDKVLKLPYFHDGVNPKAILSDKEFGDLVKPEPETAV